MNERFFEDSKNTIPLEITVSTLFGCYLSIEGQILINRE